MALDGALQSRVTEEKVETGSWDRRLQTFFFSVSQNSVVYCHPRLAFLNTTDCQSLVPRNCTSENLDDRKLILQPLTQTASRLAYPHVCCGVSRTLCPHLCLNILPGVRLTFHTSLPACRRLGRPTMEITSAVQLSQLKFLVAPGLMVCAWNPRSQAAERQRSFQVQDHLALHRKYQARRERYTKTKKNPC